MLHRYALLKGSEMSPNLIQTDVHTYETASSKTTPCKSLSFAIRLKQRSVLLPPPSSETHGRAFNSAYSTIDRDYTQTTHRVAPPRA